MKNKTRHLFLVFNATYENTNIDTINEHIYIDKNMGEVIWGQFTTHPNQNQFEQLKIKVLDSQVENNIPTFVFFYSGKSGQEKELYCADYIAQYGRRKIGSDIMDLVPTYYHDRVNADPVQGKYTCKSYVRVRNIRKISISHLDNMYQFESPYYSVEKIIEEYPRPKPVLYINLDEGLYNRCCETFDSYSEDYDELENIEIKDKIDNYEVVISKDEIETIFVEEPIKRSEKKQSSIKREFKTRKTGYIKKAQNDKKIGDEGELFVIKVEKARLEKLGVKDIDKKIKHISLERGDGDGYDIESVDIDTSGQEVPIYIEVKTTTNKSINYPFFITKKEVEVSIVKEANGEIYKLYRVYDFDLSKGKGKIYISQGSLLDSFNCIPEVYKASK
ncbi:DUF3883 domain-containing protein [Romboutsia weinsteinii]|uniref:DUF3883 domain-containing protein n=1 Tax=Romboutsia weinsteinii TaxID=2020949 RepID=A0A371IZD7_9FIRM|nr:DUF3883 domain-containing protein [Romboutsia weinsteinii]RDY25840.1 DUF3883 domain-containing protein [Romboutsia weinsteinii]